MNKLISIQFHASTKYLYDIKHISARYPVDQYEPSFTESPRVYIIGMGFHF